MNMHTPTSQTCLGNVSPHEKEHKQIERNHITKSEDEISVHTPELVLPYTLIEAHFEAVGMTMVGKS
jgi:hypothetical protein